MLEFGRSDPLIKSRAELETDEYVPVIDTVMENFVIIKKNPEFQKETDKSK